MNSKLLGILTTLAGGFLWGFSGVCGQYLFERKGANPQWLSAWRLLFSGVVILLIAFPIYKKNVFKVFNKKNIIPFLIFAFVSLMGCQYTYYVAIAASNSATATVLEYISPAVVMLFICVAGKKLPTPVQIIALICAMAGVFIMATGGHISSLSISRTALVWGLISGLCYALYTIQSPSLSALCGLLPLLGWGSIIGSIPLFIINHEYIFSYMLPDFTGLLAFIGTSIVGVILGFGLYVKGCQIVGPVTGSLCASVEPLSSALVSFLWLGTTFKASDIVGIVLIVGTVVILALDKGKAKSVEPVADIHKSV